MRRWVLLTLVAVTATTVAAAAVTYVLVSNEQERQARLAAIDVAERFAAAWQAADWGRMDALVADPDAGAGAAHARMVERLAIEGRTVTLTDVDFAEDLDDGAVATYEATFALSGLGEWAYDGRFRLTRRDRGWVVAWRPTVLHEALAEGQDLTRQRAWPPRAPLLDRHGNELAAGPLAEVAGSVGEADAEQLEALGPPYVPGDQVGRSGLQRDLERQLAGSPGGAVHVTAPDGAVTDTLVEFPATVPDPVRTTLDPGVHAAGRTALEPVAAPAALVAIDVPSGEVRAFVNAPASGFDRALSGRYPPGSTFKAVTTTALLAHGVSPATPVDCPRTISVGGRSFRNADFAELGRISFRDAFAASCNTAFIGLAEGLPAGALTAAAGLFGFGADYDLGVPFADARFPPPADAVEQAAAAIGQGRVEATPLHMATVAAAVARGRWVPPALLVRSAAAPAPAGPESLPAAGALADLMRHAVAAGTGTAAQVPGEPVAGKTGTAEFGAGTHAWFIAFRRDLAVAVVVEGGGGGGAVAAPVARRFYEAHG